MRRRVEEERWDVKALEQVTGVPWNWGEKDEEADGRRPEGTFRKTLGEGEKVEAKKVEEEELVNMKVPKRFTITKEDVRAHGPTRGCPGCKASILGRQHQTFA